MKLILQIALGVFLGTLTSQLIVDSWHSYQKTIAKETIVRDQVEQEKVRSEQVERIRAMLLQGRQSNPSSADFVPDDAKKPHPLQE
jgi:hypothetical protein